MNYGFGCDLAPRLNEDKREPPIRTDSVEVCVEIHRGSVAGSTRMSRTFHEGDKGDVRMTGTSVQSFLLASSVPRAQDHSCDTSVLALTLSRIFFPEGSPGTERSGACPGLFQKKVQRQDLNAGWPT